MRALTRSTLVLLLAAPAVRAQSVLYELEGGQTDDRYGHSLAAAGDVNNDGFPDFIAGALQLGTGPGYAQVVSGADGSILFTVTHTDLAPATFGESVAGGGDLDGDGHADFLVGAKSYSTASTGYVRVFSGLDASILYTLAGDELSDDFGQSCAVLDDVDGDAVPDILVGANQQSKNGPGYVRVFSGATGTPLYRINGAPPGQLYERFGQDVASLGDLDFDGAGDFVVGYPQPNDGIGLGIVYSGKRGAQLLRLPGNSLFDRFGEVVANAGDVDGNGVADIAVAASTNTSNAGYVKVFSGVDGALLHELSSSFGNDRFFGADVASAGDVDRDGFGDVAVSSERVIAEPGYVEVFSGRTGQTLYRHFAGNYLDHIGQSLAFVGDLDGDGFAEVAAGSGYTCCTTGFPAGFVRVLTPHPLAAWTYCVAKVNSQGCTPGIGASGLPTLGGPDDFFVTATDVINGKPGLFFFGFAPRATPFFGGTLCVEPPFRRTPVQLSGGNPPPSDCSGSYAFHFTQALMTAQGLSAGTAVFGQYWSRDVSHPDLTAVGLTDGIQFLVCP